MSPLPQIEVFQTIHKNMLPMAEMTSSISNETPIALTTLNTSEIKNFILEERYQQEVKDYTLTTLEPVCQNQIPCFEEIFSPIETFRRPQLIDQNQMVPQTDIRLQNDDPMLSCASDVEAEMNKAVLSIMEPTDYSMAPIHPMYHSESLASPMASPRNSIDSGFDSETITSPCSPVSSNEAVFDESESRDIDLLSDLGFGEKLDQTVFGTAKKRRSTRTQPQLWQFLLEILCKEDYNPSHIKWISKEQGIFKFVQNQKVAKLWAARRGHRSNKMSYEFLSRALRHYYKKSIVSRIASQRLTYRFGEGAAGWRNVVFSTNKHTGF